MLNSKLFSEWRSDKELQRWVCLCFFQQRLKDHFWLFYLQKSMKIVYIDFQCKAIWIQWKWFSPSGICIFFLKHRNTNKMKSMYQIVCPRSWEQLKYYRFFVHTFKIRYLIQPLPVSIYTVLFNRLLHNSFKKSSCVILENEFSMNRWRKSCMTGRNCQPGKKKQLFFLL